MYGWISADQHLEVNMSNNKQSMKLYTEEQVKKMLDLARFTYNSEDKILLSQIPIQLPSDEQIDKEIEWLDNPLERLNFKAGIKWMRDKIRIQRR
jgi:hypothetical protein